MGDGSAKFNGYTVDLRLDPRTFDDLCCYFLFWSISVQTKEKQSFYFKGRSQ